MQRPEAGDLVVFRPRGGYQHVGVIVDGMQFLHAQEFDAVVVTPLSHPYWSRRFEGWYLHIEVVPRRFLRHGAFRRSQRFDLGLLHKLVR